MGVSLLSKASIITLKNGLWVGAPWMIIGAVLLFKLFCMVVYAKSRTTYFKRNRIEWSIFILQNITSPVPFGFLETVLSTTETWFSRFEELLFVLTLASLESLICSTIFIIYGTDEILPFRLRIWQVWITVNALQLLCVLLWYAFITRFYLWRDVIFAENTNQSEKERLDSHATQQPLKTFSEDNKEINCCTRIHSIRQVVVSVLVGSIYVGIIIAGLSFAIIRSPSTQYSNCSHVKLAGAADGLYELDVRGTNKFLYCRDGATLVQRRRINKGNQAYYFDRSEKEYEEGFGYTGMNYWLGLEMMQQLNSDGNRIFLIEGIVQNKSKFWVEFDIRMGERNSTFGTYPLLSVVQVNSSNGLAYTFARPKIKMGSRLALTDERFDMNYINGIKSFVSKDNLDNRTCPISKHSSWWFPLQRDIQGSVHCEFNVNFDTNLNGVYHSNSTKNEFRIFACNITDEDTLSTRKEHIVDKFGGLFNCLTRDYKGYYKKNDHGQALPLEELQIFLKSSQ